MASESGVGSGSKHPDPFVFDIVRGSLVDGPGIRTVVFLKGCALRCVWCQNPESQSPGPEIAVHPEECIACGDCLVVCPDDAIELSSAGLIDRELCSRCGRCPDVCEAQALRTIGRPYGPEELVEISLRDKAFFDVSGGGVTFSGGEPLLHIDYVASVSRLLKAEGVGVAVETSGYFEYEAFARQLLGLVEPVLFDLKLFDPDAHLAATGGSNRLILANFTRLREAGVELVVRIPLVPGFTTGNGNLDALADFLRGHGIAPWELLTYNPSGLEKRSRLGIPVPSDIPPDPMPDYEELEIRQRFERRMTS